MKRLSEEIHDMIQLASVQPTEDSIGHLLDIRDALNRRIDELENIIQK